MTGKHPYHALKEYVISSGRRSRADRARLRVNAWITDVGLLVGGWLTEGWRRWRS